MEIVLYTQRVEIVKNYGERRDCADQSIPRFIEACGYLPVPMPNIWSVAEHMLTCLNPSGIVFTGGNSLEKYGGDARKEMNWSIRYWILHCFMDFLYMVFAGACR